MIVVNEYFYTTPSCASARLVAQNIGLGDECLFVLRVVGVGTSERFVDKDFHIFTQRFNCVSRPKSRGNKVSFIVYIEI